MVNLETLALVNLFSNRLANELFKAMIAVRGFAEDQRWNRYCGTSYSTVVASPCLRGGALEPGCGLAGVAQAMAAAWIEVARDLASPIEASMSSQDHALLKQYGIFYAAEVSPKALAIAMGHVIESDQLARLGVPDLYCLPEYPPEQQEEIEHMIAENVTFPVTRQTLLLADSTIPDKGPQRYVLPPCDMNVLLVELGRKVRRIVAGQRRDEPDNLFGGGPSLLLSADSDNPYRSWQHFGGPYVDGGVFTPGLTLMGSTGSPGAVNIFTIYRLAAVAQLLRGNVISSRVEKAYQPFTFFGMGTPLDIATGMLDLSALRELRYLGNLDIKREFDLNRKELERLAFAGG